MAFSSISYIEWWQNYNSKNNNSKKTTNEINWGVWQIAGGKWPYLFPTLPFIHTPLQCDFAANESKVNSAFPPFVSDLTLQFALPNRIRWKWHHACWKPRHVSLCRTSSQPQVLEPKLACWMIKRTWQQWCVIQAEAILDQPALIIHRSQLRPEALSR